MPEKKNTIGRFEIIEKIGEGPIGAVFKALDPVIRRTVAIKVIKLYALEETTTFAEIFEKIYRVVRTSTSLNHPNICIIYDLSEEKKIPYVTMEYVEGHDLDTLLQKKHQFKRQELLNVLQQVCDALDFAHKKNVVHQDLKSTNILVTPELHVKITDFGIAGLDEIAAAQTKKLLSIPFYISPEQALGERVSPASDLFSLGVVIYHLLSGQLPFPGTTAANTIMMIARDNPSVPLDLQKSGIRRDAWDSFFSTALAKSPAQRYRTARDMFDALLAILPENDQSYFPYTFAGQFDDSTGEFEKTYMAESPPTVMINASEIMEQAQSQAFEPEPTEAEAAADTWTSEAQEEPAAEPEQQQRVEPKPEPEPQGQTLLLENAPVQSDMDFRKPEPSAEPAAYQAPPTQMMQFPSQVPPQEEPMKTAPPEPAEEAQMEQAPATQLIAAPSPMTIMDEEFPDQGDTIPPQSGAPATELIHTPPPPHPPQHNEVEEGATLISASNQFSPAPPLAPPEPPRPMAAPTEMISLSSLQQQNSATPEYTAPPQPGSPTIISTLQPPAPPPPAPQPSVAARVDLHQPGAPAPQPQPAIIRPATAESRPATAAAPKSAGPPNLKRYYFGAIALAIFIAVAGFIFFTALFKDSKPTDDSGQTQTKSTPVKTTPSKPAPVPATTPIAPTTGTLVVTSDPEGATVLLNDVDKGVTPLEVTDLPFGMYSLKLQLKGYKEIEQQLEVNETATRMDVPVALEKAVAAAGTMVVESNPPGAFIVIGNRVLGVTPKTLPNQRPGNYEVTLKKDGYEDFEGSVRIRSERTATLRADLVEIPKPVVVVEKPKPKPPEVTPGQLVQLGPDVVPPKPIKKVFAKYPDRAKARRIEGTVVLSILVSETGKVIDTKVTRSAHPLLDEAVIEAYRQWEYEPARKKGVPVKVWVPVSMTFQASSR